jgi:hypothetical protein
MWWMIPRELRLLLVLRPRPVKSGRNLLQSLPQSIAKLREDFGGRFAQAIFRGRRDLCNYISRLMIQGRYGRHHPGIGNVFQPSAILFRRFIADLAKPAAQFRQFRFAQGFPAIQHISERRLHLGLRLVQPLANGFGHGSLESPQELFLFGRDTMIQFRARRIHLLA